MDQAAGPTIPPRRAGVPAVPQAGQAPGSSSDRVPALAWLTAAAFVAVELAVSGRYGFMQDELYFVEAARHLAFGYVEGNYPSKGGVGEKAAWFKDSEGNLLAIGQAMT
jgi:hypothetical protein